jgi:hypothetical protein
VASVDELQLRELKRLCEQALRLQRDAEKLCRQIQTRIDRSRSLHAPPPPLRVERRRFRR